MDINLTEISFWAVLLKITLSLLAGGVLGLERGKKSRPAGFRTYMLVCLGACLVMMTNQYVFLHYKASDPVRLGAQVISGIGFLGAGTIIMTGKNHIRGITTAAGLWTSACCGLAIGVGFYSGAIAGTVAVYLVMTVMQKVDYYIHQRAKQIDLYVELDDEGSFSQLFHYLRGCQFEISDIQMDHGSLANDSFPCGIVSIRSRVKRTHTEMIDVVEKYSHLQYLEEMGL